IVGRTAMVSARIANVGARRALDFTVHLSVLGDAGTVAAETTARIADLGPGASTVVSVPWKPIVAGAYSVGVEADDGDAVAEVSEDNNRATTGALVLGAEALAVGVSVDRAAHAPRSEVFLRVELANGGAAHRGPMRTTVEDPDGRVVAVVDERSVDLAYGATLAVTLSWNTGRTYAGDYAFHVRVLDGGGEVRAQATATLS